MAGYIRPGVQEGQPPGFFASSSECPECHEVLVLRTDDYTCSEWCVFCQRSTLYAWTSCLQPALRLEARPQQLTALLTEQYRAQA
jgi:hypothetical protein